MARFERYLDLLNGAEYGLSEQEDRKESQLDLNVRNINIGLEIESVYHPNSDSCPPWTKKIISQPQHQDNHDSPQNRLLRYAVP